MAFAKPAVDLCDLALEVVDQLDRRRDVASPALRNLESGEQAAALGPEQVGDRAGLPKLIIVKWTRFLSPNLCLTRCI